MGTDSVTEVQDLWMLFVARRDQKLRNELITLYAPLVRFVVGRLGIPPTGVLEAEDLISYGMIGLINAVDRFDPTRGVRFEAFATVRIRGAVIDQLRSLNWLPRSAISRVRQIEGALAVLEQKLGRPAKEEEVAVELGVTVERYRQMLMEMNASVLSLDAPLNSFLQDDEVTSLAELLEDHTAPGPVEQTEHQELTDTLSAAIEHLPEREKLLLALYYQEELTMKEISKVLSVSESRVCQLHMQAIMRLRAALYAYRSDEGAQGSEKVAQESQEYYSQKVTVERRARTYPTNPSSNTGKTNSTPDGPARHKRKIS
ncbi:sigma-70 family RNA polymerase sigma factor [Tengunoibacter tsumagoiensis]|uniref:RNA polymerase sigma factor n=1 Tax=Tengunoibacter tsumagoiensis TaxID=2014871 RepID=A0A402A4C5_9CHLR|nr:FliA/WhiG family RNA polymerase sigma factor [Tengunoibacter tsumagoiensis]GCE13906.1 sigma 28 [Tengunoibacter tsumagoiensis]